MDKYKVSVLTPIFKVEKYIQKCVISLFSQTLDDIEFIFIDDCSSDRSIEILHSVISLYPNLNDRIQIIRHETNMGVAIARKTALDNATGTYILFVDSDDYIDPTMIEQLYKKALESEADMVFCSYYSEYKNGKANRNLFNPTYDRKELIKKSFLNPAFWNKLFKRDLIQKNNIQIVENINYSEDLALIPQLIYFSNTFAFIEEPLYHYVLHNQNAITKKLTENHIKQTLYVVDLLSNFFLEKDDTYIDIVMFLKANRKAKILRSGRIENKYINLFPEIQPSLNKLDLDYKTKTMLFLAQNKKKALLRIFIILLTKKII